MPIIPAFLLKKLYVDGSLKCTDQGVSLSLKNTLAPGTIIGVSSLEIDGTEHPAERVTFGRQGAARPADRITPAAPLAFNLNQELEIHVAGLRLEPGTHSVKVRVNTKEVGELNIQIEDHV